MQIKSMRHLILAGLMTVWLSLALAQQSQHPLTNSSIVEMVKAGLGDNVVMAAIRSQPHQFNLSATDLITLKQAGVSDAVIAAILTPVTPEPVSPVTATSVVNSLADVRTIFIDGNNESANNARNDLLKTIAKNPNNACFKPVGVRKLADAILQIAESDTAGGSGGILGGTNLESTVASGTLINAEGDMLWSNSKQGMQGVFHTGAGDAARNLIIPLYLAAGCTSGGVRQTIGASEAASVSPQNLTYIRKLYLTGSKQRAISSGPKDLATHTCLEAVSNPAMADAVVVLDQSSAPLPRGVFKLLYSSAKVESKASKTPLWTYDEGDVFRPGSTGGVHMWWEQLNEAVGCGKTKKQKSGDWPSPQPKT